MLRRCTLGIRILAFLSASGTSFESQNSVRGCRVYRAFYASKMHAGYTDLGISFGSRYKLRKSKLGTRMSGVIRILCFEDARWVYGSWHFFWLAAQASKVNTRYADVGCIEHSMLRRCTLGIRILAFLSASGISFESQDSVLGLFRRCTLGIRILAFLSASGTSFESQNSVRGCRV